MELFNSTLIPNDKRYLSPKLPIWIKKTPPYPKIPLHPPFSLSLPLSNPTKLLVSAQFGRPTTRRNSLRKKVTHQQQQVRDKTVPNTTPYSDLQYPVPVIDETINFQSEPVNGSKNEENNGIEIIEEQSVLWSKLRDWVDQYNKDSEFWGIGSGAIFTVYQDSDGNIKRVAVNEDEILRRSRIEPLLYKQRKLEDLTEVNSKISQAKFLAREIENGRNVIPKNSSVARFVLSSGHLGVLSAMQGVLNEPRVLLRLSTGGIVVLCGLIVFWAAKMLCSGGGDRVGYTRLEKEMMRRKIKGRMQKERMEKGGVEVIQDSKELEIVPTKRPQLNRQELMDSIIRAKGSKDEAEMPEFSGVEATNLDKKIQEIRSMARCARELESRGFSPADNGGEDDQNVNESSIQEEVVQQNGDGLQTFSINLPDGLKETPQNACADDPKVDNSCFLDDVSVENNSNFPPTCTLSSKVSHDGERRGAIVMEDRNNMVEEYQSLDGFSSKTPLRTKLRVILSVEEAREYLSRKRNGQQPCEDTQLRTIEEVAITSNEKVMDGNPSQILKKTDKDFDSYTLSGSDDYLYFKNATEGFNLERKESFPAQDDDPASASGYTVPTDLQVHRSSSSDEEMSISGIPPDNEMKGKGGQRWVKDSSVLQHSFMGRTSNSMPAAVAYKDSTFKDGNLSIDNDDHEDFEEGETITGQLFAKASSEHGTNGRTAEAVPLMKDNWMDKNFHELDPIFRKIGDGFRDNYMVARERVNQELDLDLERLKLKFDEDDGDLDWMKDNRLKEIVFKVRENELAGRDPFHLMDAEDKLAFFEGLEKKVETENEKLKSLHEWIHSSIENLDYGADGISLYDPPEKFIPHWKGPPVESSPEILNSFVQQKSAIFAERSKNSTFTKMARQSSLQRSEDSPLGQNMSSTVTNSNQQVKILHRGERTPKTVIEGSDGSVRAGKKDGKEYWQHTKKWSRGFLEAYNAETDTETKAVMKDIGKDLDRWITEKEIKEAAELMDKIPERGQRFIKEKLGKIKREMEMFGPQAVVSKYREYAEEEEDYLWWLDLPFVLCIELYTKEDGDMKVGFYSLEMAADLELDPKQYHVIAFEYAGDCKNLCYIIQAHMEKLGIGSAFVVASPPKDAFREAKANGFNVTVIRKGDLRLNVDQTLDDVEEQIIEIGSKIYHDNIMKAHSVDISSLMKGVFGVRKPSKRKRLRRRLKKPTNEQPV